MHDGVLMEKDMLEFKRLARLLGRHYKIQRYDLGLWQGYETTLYQLKSGEETCT